MRSCTSKCPSPTRVLALQQDAAAVTATPHPVQPKWVQPTQLQVWWGAARAWWISSWVVLNPLAAHQRQYHQLGESQQDGGNPSRLHWAPPTQQRAPCRTLLGWLATAWDALSPQLTHHHHHHHHHHSQPAAPNCNHLSHMEIATTALYRPGPNLTNGAFSANGSYNCYVSAEYESGALHSVILGQGPEGPLLPSTTYFYQVGDPRPGGELSPIFSFNTTPSVGPQSLPYRYVPAATFHFCKDPQSRSSALPLHLHIPPMQARLYAWL